MTVAKQAAQMYRDERKVAHTVRYFSGTSVLPGLCALNKQAGRGAVFGSASSSAHVHYCAPHLTVTVCKAVLLG